MNNDTKIIKPYEKRIAYGIIAAVILLIVLFPFVFTRFFCYDTIIIKIMGFIVILSTTFPLVPIGFCLLLYLSPLIISILYTGYYYLIYRNWCTSILPFFIVGLIYFMYFILLYNINDIVKIMSSMYQEMDTPSKNEE